MRIRSGFVSNSSSTSFLIITEGELTIERFMALVGVQSGSPMEGIFAGLFESITESIWSTADFGMLDPNLALSLFHKQKNMDLSEKMLEKIDEAKQKGLTVMYGELSSEENLIETFFCCDSFEVEGNGLYLNALQAGW